MPRFAVFALPALALTLTLVAAVVLSWTAIDSKINNQNAVNAGYHQAKSLLPDSAANRKTVIVVAAEPPSSFVGRPYPFWNNSSGVDATRLFAADLGPATYQLGLQFPDRQLIRLSLPEPPPYPGLPASPGSVTPLTTATGSALWVHATFTSPTTGGVLTAYLTVDHRRQVKVLTRSSISGSVFHVDWLLSAADLRQGPRYVTVGLAQASGPGKSISERWEQRLSAGPAASGIATQSPGYPWHLTPTPTSAVWQQMSVAAVVRVQVDQTPTAPPAP